jgi:signal peptidase I
MSESTPKVEHPSAPAAKEGEDWRSFAWFCLRLAVLVLVFRSFVFTSFNIPSESMMPRLLVGDFLFAAKWRYGYSRYSLPTSPSGATSSSSSTRSTDRTTSSA